ncbi:MAG: FAD-dependent thymidylate synthase [Deltaproteobacteria bacterium]|nr:FAD-dependent thymidylate synthase [Deltaproteobacteria bacterium]
MKIILAGYNIDADIIEAFRKINPEADNLTPETIAAAYARISRSPKSVTELRAIAREEVEKARKSAKNIAFDMGHSSIAEHAVFNMDVIGVSRLLVEEIEKFRLCSYTEKSQRYVLFKDDFVIPEEIRQAGLEKPYVDIIRKQNRLYYDLYEKLKPHVFAKNPEMAKDRVNASTLEGWAKEDARYIISLATQTQLGLTINARNLELMLRRLAAHPLNEASQYSRELYEATKDTAPSLIRYTEATPYDRQTKPVLKAQAEALAKTHPAMQDKGKGARGAGRDVVLCYATPDADNRILSSLLHTASSATLTECEAVVSEMKKAKKKEFLKNVFLHMKNYDVPPREFESVDLQFEMIVSASCFAQLKRHRMATITGQDYNPALGVTVPPAVVEIGMKDRFMDVIAETNDIHKRIKDAAPMAAPYVLTNAHRKRVAVKVNARELYHIVRLRADRHAQWDIRAASEKMLALGKKVMPLTLMMAAGKDGFGLLHDELFPPKSKFHQSRHTGEETVSQ